MAIKYDTIVPWGRSYQEYLAMFGLGEADINKNILGCGDGPASFNSIMHEKGGRVTSIDPLYHFTASEIAERIKSTSKTVLEQTRQNQDKFIWTKIRSVEELAELRMNAMHTFLADFENGKAKKRYIAAELPHLPFNDQQFDLALSSHFLFLYSDNLSLSFHVQSLDEMLRVANEVRVFPLVDVNTVRSPYVESITDRYVKAGYCIAELQVDYEFQKGGNMMLCIKKFC